MEILFHVLHHYSCWYGTDMTPLDDQSLFLQDYLQSRTSDTKISCLDNPVKTQGMSWTHPVSQRWIVLTKREGPCKDVFGRHETHDHERWVSHTQSFFQTVVLCIIIISGSLWGSDLIILSNESNPQLEWSKKNGCLMCLEHHPWLFEREEGWYGYSITCKRRTCE